MFRYLALIWDDTLPAPRAAAQYLAHAMQGKPAWRVVLRASGLWVFTTGGGADGNGVHDLGGGQGVILGRLFRQRNDGPSTALAGALERDEAQAVLASQGAALMTHWWGRYVAFLSGHLGGETTLLRDPTGTLPCFRLAHDGVQCVCSWLEDLIALPAVPLPPVAWDRLNAHLRSGESGDHQTVLEGVERVLPGEAIHWGRAGERRELLWNAVSIAQAVIDDEPARLAARLRDTVRDCVHAWAGGQPRILLRLSGGVDSSILASCLTSADARAEVLCVNYHSAGADTDERYYARLAARQAGLTLIECERDERYALERVLGVALTPSPTTYVGRMAASVRDAELSQQYGAACLFTGAGGDQLFFELRTWWPAADFLWQRGVGRGAWSAMMDAARLARLSVWKTAALALRMQVGLSASGDALSWTPALLGEAAHAQSADTHGHPLLTGEAALPVGKLNHLRMLLHPLAYYDPYECERAPAVVNPLMSQPLIELCLRLPTYRLTDGGQGRALARRAFRADLPAPISARRSKGSIDAHLKAVLAHNRAFARALLLEGELVARGWLDRAKVEAALSDRPQTDAVHVSEIHGHIAVEAWLQRWRSAARSGAAT